MCFLILFYRMKLMCLADHVNSLLLIFCSFSFILSLVPIVSFCSYLILMSKRKNLIYRLLFLKGDSNPKLFSSLYSFLSYQRKFSPPHPGYQIFKNFPTSSPSRLFQRPRLLSFEEFSTPPPFIPTPLLLFTQE